MRVLLTGSTGYIGKRLMVQLLMQGHELYCCARDVNRLSIPTEYKKQVIPVEVDFLDIPPIERLPRDIDAAYYLIHSMSSDIRNFERLEAASAVNFRNYMEKTSVKQVIYLGGIANENDLSKHLASRKKVEELLRAGKYATTVLRAGIIIGSGSASFEIIRDLVEKLPVMITPRWVLTRSQPIALKDVLRYLSGVLGNKECYNKSFDIGGPDILTYRDMMLAFARARKLKRYILTIPFMTPRLSSYWLYFVTSTSYKLAVNLVNSMKVEVVCGDDALQKLLEINPTPYEESVNEIFRISFPDKSATGLNSVSVPSRQDNAPVTHFEVPEYGCYRHARKIGIPHGTEKRVMKRIFEVMDPGRENKQTEKVSAMIRIISWKVLVSDREHGRLLLFTETKLPGEAWLEFRLGQRMDDHFLMANLTFRPRGVSGRLFWKVTYPIHHYIFITMIKKILQ